MISDQISVDLLRLYVAVCRQGSLSRVAVQAGRTQSAVSMQIRRLEDMLGRRLFQRTGRGVVTTADGELFLGYAVRMLALGDEAAARFSLAGISGAVRVGLAEELSTSALPAALGRLRRAFPDLALDVTVEHSVALGRTWDDGDLDLMVAPTSVAAGDALFTWNVDLLWVAAADRVPDPRLPLDLAAFGATCPWRRRMVEALAAGGRAYRIVLTSQSMTALQAGIECGLGIGLLPRDAIRPATMRVLRPDAGLPAVLAVQYGLYARDRRGRVVEAAIAVLRDGLPAAD